MKARYTLLNNLIGGLIFIVAAFTYCSTAEPTTSFWDCGEYIASCFKLEVGHPPGAPTFLILGRFFTLFASDNTQAAFMINIMSALSSALTILFMFWSITMLGRRLVKAVGSELTDGRVISILGAGIVGSLAYTFSDSFWFSAVEGEVYGMSSFFTALVVWGILKWDADDSPRADRWLVFIAYMMGLSIGVHLLNLLAIPAIVLIVYFKKFTPTPKGIVIALVAAVGLLGVIQNGIIPGIVSGAANYELFFVNGVGLPFNFGTVMYFLLLIGMIVFGLMYTVRGTDGLFKLFVGFGSVFFAFVLFAALGYGKALMPFLTVIGAGALVYYLRNNRAVLNVVLLSFATLLIGYSTFLVLVIRSQANTPMDENNPENAISLLSYLNREQYGDWPLVYGPYYNALLDAEDPVGHGNPVYVRNDQLGEYVISDHRYNVEPHYASEMSTFLPRMWDTNMKSHVAEYEKWGNVRKNSDKVRVRDYQTGQLKNMTTPSFTANLAYLFDYQMGWMYWRYFMWNFAGRQNDIQGHGNPLDGNYMSGLSAIDKANLTFIGPGVPDMKNAPKAMKENKAKNNFYLIPLILGIIGIVFHFRRDWKSALVVTLVFLFTGLAIVFYLNQYPLQPRERDYAYAGSFYAFSIWIGLAVMGIAELFMKQSATANNGKRKLFVNINDNLTKALGGNSEMAGAALATVLAFVAPFLMGAQGWDDHDRSNRYTARDFAKNYLASCEQNAILFTNGDNDTFPLWYVQEVENFRTDVRVINLSLLNTDWYIEQAIRKAYDSDPVPFSLPKRRFRQGSCDQVPVAPQVEQGKDKLMSARQAIDFIISNDRNTKETRQIRVNDSETYTDTICYLPTSKLYIPVDIATCRANKALMPYTPDSLVPKTIEWQLKDRYLGKSDLMVLDLLASNNWKRPIYFSVTAGDVFLGLDDYLRLEGLTYRLVPVKAPRKSLFNERVSVDTDILFKNVMAFEWGGLDKAGESIYMDENNLRFTTNHRLQMVALAKALNEDGKKDKAVSVLDRCLTAMPKANVPYEVSMVYHAEQYYRAGAMEKGNALSKEIFAVAEEQFTFLSSLMRTDRTNAQYYSSEASRLEPAMAMLTNLAAQNKQTAVYNELAGKMTALGLQPPPAAGVPMQNPDEGSIEEMLPDSILDQLRANDSGNPNAGLKPSVRKVK
jgi:hypothetical protein